jgi:hypothetical protein
VIGTISMTNHWYVAEALVIDRRHHLEDGGRRLRLARAARRARKARPAPPANWL